MGHRFTDDDRGKDVVTPEGDRVGTIDRVDDDRAEIQRDQDADLTDKVKNMLGWDDDDQNEIRDEHVDRTEDDRVYLRQN